MSHIIHLQHLLLFLSETEIWEDTQIGKNTAMTKDQFLVNLSFIMHSWAQLPSHSCCFKLWS